MGTWAENLIRTTLFGLEIPLSEREMGGGESIARHRPAFSQGQTTESTGRDPYTFELRIPLFHEIDPNHYPNLKERIRATLDDRGTQALGEYVDPEIGPITVRATKWRWRSEPTQRNGGWYTISLEEDTGEIFTLEGTDEAPTTSAEAAETADVDLGELGIGDADLLDAWAEGGAPAEPNVVAAMEPGAGFSTVIDDLRDGIANGTAIADEVRARVDRVRRQIDATLQLEAVQGPEGWIAQGSLYELAEAVEREAERAMRNAATLVTYTPRAGMSAVEIALVLYGDPSRADEIASRNNVYHPLFVTGGLPILVLSR